MEQTQHSLRQAQPAYSRVQIAARSPLMFMLLLMLVSLFATAAVVILMAKSVGHVSLSDPFTVYADVFPGQPAEPSALEARGFSCTADLLLSPADLTEDCSYSVVTGAVSAINVVIWDSVVKRLDFMLRQGALSIGDLALVWGSPEIHKTGRWVSLKWTERHVSGSSWAEDGQFSYFQSVMQLSFGG